MKRVISVTGFIEIKPQVGHKRAIVTIARKLVILARLLVLDQTYYQPPLLKIA